MSPRATARSSIGSSGLSRDGDYSFVYLGQLVGIVLMFAGFTLPARAPYARSAHRSPPRCSVAA
jgi:hypothetical protein